MRETKISLLYILVLAISVGMNAYPSWGTEVLKLGHMFPPESNVGKGAERCADLVKTKSDGKAIIEIFPSGTLGSISQLLKLVQRGSIDLAVIPNRLLAALDARVGVLDLPFLFFSYKEADEFLEGKVGKSILRILSGADVRGLCYFELGFIGIANKVRPINKFEDYKGLNIRIGPPNTVADSIRRLRALPIRIPPTEVYAALQRVKGSGLFLTIVRQCRLVRRLSGGRAPILVSCGIFQLSGECSDMELSRYKILNNSKMDSQIQNYS